MEKATDSQSVQIKAPNMRIAVFNIHGTAPLVIHRFSEKHEK